MPKINKSSEEWRISWRTAKNSFVDVVIVALRNRCNATTFRWKFVCTQKAMVSHGNQNSIYCKMNAESARYHSVFWMVHNVKVTRSRPANLTFPYSIQNKFYVTETKRAKTDEKRSQFSFHFSLSLDAGA